MRIECFHSVPPRVDVFPEQIRLFWRAPGAEYVVLSGYGRVAATESRGLVRSLTAPATFTLTAYGARFGEVEAEVCTVSMAGLVPHDAIALWSGSVEDIPAGWGLCDGRDGLPN